MSEDNQYLEDERFFDLSQKLNQIRRERNFLQESEYQEDLYQSEDLEEEEEFVDLYESAPEEMDELEWRWWWENKRNRTQP